MKNLIGRIRPHINRFTISGAIFFTGGFVIAANADIVPSPSAMPIYGPTEAEQYAIRIAPRLEEFVTEQEQIRQLSCVAMTVWAESRSESGLGQTAVAEVIMNRVRSHRYPNTPCEVVFQHKQFSAWNEGDTNGPAAIIAFERETPSYSVLMAIYYSKKVMGGQSSLMPNKALHYARHDSNPYWANTAEIRHYERIGNHIFYH